MNYKTFRFRIRGEDIAAKMVSIALAKNWLGYYELGQFEHSIVYYIPTKKYGFGYIEFMTPKKFANNPADKLHDFLRQRRIGYYNR